MSRVEQKLMPGHSPVRFATLAILLGVTFVTVSAGQTQTPSSNDDLVLSQSELADRYARLEKLILRMAEFDAADNPRRAELLKKAFGIAKERHVQLQFETLVKLLSQDKLARALNNQNEVKSDLNSILELLLTENRADRLKDEQTRIRNYIREIERLERIQRSVQGRTQGGVDAERLVEEQGRVADRTARLHQEIAQNESPGQEAEETDQQDGAAEQDGKPQDGEPSDGEPQNGTPQDGKSQDGKPSDGKPTDAKPDGEPSDSQPNDSKSQDGKPNDDKRNDGKPQDGKPSDGQPSGGQASDGKPQDGQPSDQPGNSQPGGQSPDGQPENSSDSQSSPPPEQFPGQEKIRQAQEKMERAQQKLAEAQRTEAIEDQEEAVRKLAEAKAELERILRQRREEEIERVLALLESRFRKMLEMELQVYENTIRLYKIPANRRDRFVDIEAGKLSFAQRRIVVEADKCLALLREEGSSVAFPESVQQMREDMERVEDRLGRAQIGRLTQGLEEDIIEALDEMVAALQKAQMDQEQRRSEMQMGQPMDPNDQSLVDQIAELRMLKAMQLRINKRTARYSRLLDDEQDQVGQATDNELIEALQELSQREFRLQEITHDIVINKNK